MCVCVCVCVYIYIYMLKMNSLATIHRELSLTGRKSFKTNSCLGKEVPRHPFTPQPPVWFLRGLRLLTGISKGGLLLCFDSSQLWAWLDKIKTEPLKRFKAPDPKFIQPSQSPVQRPSYLWFKLRGRITHAMWLTHQLLTVPQVQH